MPPVAAPMPEMTANGRLGGVGTGALPLQKPRFPENETALLKKGGTRLSSTQPT
jgi:hypothetical protein